MELLTNQRARAGVAPGIDPTATGDTAMMLKAPFDLSEIKPKCKQYRVEGRKGIRVIRATNTNHAARQYLGHTYFWWVDGCDFDQCDIYESDTDGSRLYVDWIA